jgi:hypothetical protein
MDIQTILNAMSDFHIVPMLVNLVTSYPKIATVFLIMGAARAIMKPLMTLLRTVAEQTPSTKDNELLDQVEKSKVFKTVEFVLDYVASIKLPKK